jgi:hypothetical protein
MIVVFDMDECIASLSDPCEEYHKYIEHGYRIPRSFTNDFRDGLKREYLRPGIDELLKVLYGCKMDLQRGNPDCVLQVYHIVLMTNASNEYGWVDFVSEHINYILGTKGDLFDILLPRNSQLRTQVSYEEFHKYGGMQPKFMDDVIRSLNITDPFPIVMFDDHKRHLVPAKGRRNYMIRVPKYHSDDYDKHDRTRTFASFLPPLLMAMNSLRKR